jgi:hypothetical protein
MDSTMLYNELVKGKKYDADTEQSILQYLAQLSSIQVKAIKIASAHLGTSFNVIKSNGYIDWKKEQQSPV